MDLQKRLEGLSPEDQLKELSKIKQELKAMQKATKRVTTIAKQSTYVPTTKKNGKEVPKTDKEGNAITHKTFGVFHADKEGNTDTYPIIRFGVEKAKAILAHIDDLKKFVEEN